MNATMRTLYIIMDGVRATVSRQGMSEIQIQRNSLHIESRPAVSMREW